MVNYPSDDELDVKHYKFLYIKIEVMAVAREADRGQKGLSSARPRGRERGGPELGAPLQCM